MTILEGVITTVSAKGAIHVAAMGPCVDNSMHRFLLRPFPSSQTYQNLKLRGEGVLHVTDDVLLLTRAALHMLDDPPPYFPASQVCGFVLRDACRYYEFQIRAIDDSQERIHMEADVVHARTLRDFFGFNRAKHAVIEAAILATRTDFLPLEEIESAYGKFAVIIQKTGGEQEHRAFALLRQHLANVVLLRRQADPAEG